MPALMNNAITVACHQQQWYCRLLCFICSITGMILLKKNLRSPAAAWRNSQPEVLVGGLRFSVRYYRKSQQRRSTLLPHVGSVIIAQVLATPECLHCQQINRIRSWFYPVAFIDDSRQNSTYGFEGFLLLAAATIPGSCSRPWIFAQPLPCLATVSGKVIRKS